jgi:putative ABC transport system permease protein
MRGFACAAAASTPAGIDAMFVVRMAWRELRWAWRRLLFFFLCLSIGVASIVTLRSVVQSVRAALRAEARSLLGGDLAVSTSREWDARTLGTIEPLLARFLIQARASQVETLTMVRPADAAKAVSRLVELLGVDSAYPLYGSLELEGGQHYSHALLAGRGVLVRPDLLAQLGAAIGDEVFIGDARFTIRGVVLREPGRRAGAFSFGTRAFVDRRDLEAAELLGFGSRATHRLLFRMPGGDTERLARELQQAFRGQFVSVRTYRSAEDQIGRELGRAENYLSLVGLMIMVLGGVGVWSVIRVFMQQKLRSVAILKCVGGSTGQVLTVYVAQVALMGLTGSAIGVLMAAGAVAWLRPAVAEATGLLPAAGLTASAVVQGAGIGLLVALLFALVPLLDVRHVRPSLLLRASELARPRRDPAWYAATAGIGLLLVALAAWQAGSWRVGAILAGGFAGVSLVLVGAGALLVRAMRPLQRSRHLAVRYASRRVGRPGSQVRPVLLAVGLGVFLVAGVRVLQASLLEAMAITLRPDAPDMFLIDVQPDQAEGVRAAIRAAGSPGDPVLIPVLRARITAIRGKATTLESYEDVRGRGRGLGREYVVTYRSNLSNNERLVAGEFWPAAPPAGAQVSVEQGLAERERLEPGDVIRFDVLGRAIEATVASIRAVDWADARAGGFMFVFRPGVLEAAPGTFIAPVRAPAGAASRARFQRDLTAAFPNVSVIDVREILAGITRVLRTISLAVTVVGSLVLLSGILILAGSISMTRFQRTYEVAVLKTLGATSGHVAAMLAVEYGLIGAAAGVIGSTGALGLSWAVTRFVLDLPWEPAIGALGAAVVAASVLVAAVGVTASLDVLRRKPLATLRAE